MSLFRYQAGGIAHAEPAREFIPEFDYKIIPLKQYGNNELKKNNNEMALIMMINKVQGKEDFHEFRKEMWLTKIREEKKLSKSDFAKLLEITPMLLGKYEKGSILKAGQKNCYKG